MITLHKAVFRNVLSYGNYDTEISFDSHRATIITAKNGQGKSTILDVLCYGLYGKPYRNIKLGQLINSINNKGLIVTVWFSVGSDEFKIVRGQKPNVFEIWKNNELIPEEAASRDYQNLLEQSILKINFKTFKQVVVIGSANYIPFMQLTPADRRNITEEVLDIAVFSEMQEIAKRRLNELKSITDSLEYEIKLKKDQIESHKKILVVLEEDCEKKKRENDETRNRIHKECASIESQIRVIDNDIQELLNKTIKYSVLVEGKKSIQKTLTILESTVNQCNEQIKFFEQDSCPTCTQSISSDLRHSFIEQNSCKIGESEHKISQMETLLMGMNEKIDTIESILHTIQEKTTDKRIMENKLVSLTRELANIKTDVNEGSIETTKDIIRECVSDVLSKTEQKGNMQNDMTYYRMCVDMLKDSGIKASIITNFVPVINSIINEYLEKFDMFVNFELDETFNETIKSRNRDVFTYNSFSEGEKQKIDLAILFAWRQIAISKNSVNVNLLMFDETLDASLDSESVDVFVDILSSLDDSVNAMVISHRAVVPEIFDRHIQIVKTNDFSKVLDA